MDSTINRRRFLKNSIMVGGAAAALQSFEEKALGAEIGAAKPKGPATAAVEPLQIPTGKIKKLEISRVICGGNLIGGWAQKVAGKINSDNSARTAVLMTISCRMETATQYCSTLKATTTHRLLRCAQVRTTAPRSPSRCLGSKIDW